MYSIFLPFAAIVIDLCVAYIYFKVYIIIYAVQCLLFAANNPQLSALCLKDGQHHLNLT